MKPADVANIRISLLLTIWNRYKVRYSNRYRRSQAMKRGFFVLLLFLTVFSAAAAESFTTNGRTVIDFTALPYQSETGHA